MAEMIKDVTITQMFTSNKYSKIVTEAVKHAGKIQTTDLKLLLNKILNNK